MLLLGVDALEVVELLLAPCVVHPVCVILVCQFHAHVVGKVVP